MKGYMCKQILSPRDTLGLDYDPEDMPFQRLLYNFIPRTDKLVEFTSKESFLVGIVVSSGHDISVQPALVHWDGENVYITSQELRKLQ